jgi:RNA polymerase sigma-70 factor (ECF subfamily)
VLQDTFAYLLKKLPRLRLTARMTTFLYPVVRHLSIRLARKRRRHVSDEGALDEIPAPEETGSSRAELASALSALPEKQREVLLMRIVDEMSLAEIAEALKIPLGTVKSRLHNALRTLRGDERTRRYFLE